VELFQDRQDLKADPVAGVLAGQVRGIRAVRLPDALQIAEDLPAGPLDQGPDQSPAHRRNTRETPQPGAARQVHQHGLRDVVGHVPGGDGSEPQPVGNLLREPVPFLARPLLKVRTFCQLEPPHLAADAQPFAESAYEPGVLPRLIPTQAVVHVQHRGLSAQLDERTQQRDRVRPARDQRQRATQVHPVALRRQPHGAREILRLHGDSLQRRAEGPVLRLAGLQASGFRHQGLL
jgi:hypothetical protein